ncbi:Heat-labile enterotoxin IIA, B chain [Yersinia enterocolitica]|uniref:Heat-labile enterotoxin IIA, B chain n=1 Tax=Yersinia enterocolitica TaxID=630 RepID=UPI0038BB501C
MKFKGLVTSIALGMAIVSGHVNAGASKSFKETCSKTTATLHEGISISKYYSDTNTGHQGVFFVDSGGETWTVPSAMDYPDNILALEQRKIAMAAFLTDMNVNVCAKNKVVWSIELDNE